MSYRVYPVTPTSLCCDDYTVRINGKEVSMNTARVSAMPFNRRWPGHQRQLDQTELISFLSLQTDEPLCFEIIPKEPFGDVKIRPRSLGIEPVVRDGVITFTLEKPAYFTVEPYGRHRALHVFADPVAQYDVDVHGENVLYFGAGEHDVGLIELTSNQTLFLDEGAVVYACVHAIDAENIAILGRGILDNSKNKETILYEANAEDNHEAVNNAKRRHTVELEYCQNVNIDGITIRDSLVYNVRPVGCENMRICQVKVIGCWRFNSDGIDMHNCVNTYISNCFLRTFDDSLCVKGFDCYYDGDVEQAVRTAMYRNGKAYDVFKNIVVENCVIWNDWGKSLEIGAETKAEEIYAVTFQSCDIIHVTGTVLDCMNVDYADVHDVVFRNINIECDEVIPQPRIQRSDSDTYAEGDPAYMPQTMKVEVVYHHEYSKGSEQKRGKNRHIRFENINVWGDKPPRFGCAGYDEAHMTENGRVLNLMHNGVPMEEMQEENWCVGPYCRDIVWEPNPYAQMEKNSVDARNQLTESSCTCFHRAGAKGKRVLFLGNSITLHGIRPQIGWYGEWGMAASAEEKDYVHVAERIILAQYPDTAFCICQAAEWEVNYRNGSDKHAVYQAARDFEPDIIVMRIIENCKKDGFDGAAFRRELDSLLSFLDRSGNARVVLTTGFWRHPGNEDILLYARERGLPCLELSDLGEMDEMKALGQFEHRGVANHPSDLGMQTIAERISQRILAILSEL